VDVLEVLLMSDGTMSNNKIFERKRKYENKRKREIESGTAPLFL
jgi:hypothetical protein